MAEEIARKVMEQKDTLLGTHKPAPKTAAAAPAPKEEAKEEVPAIAVEAPAKRGSKMIDIEADDK